MIFIIVCNTLIIMIINYCMGNWIKKNLLLYIKLLHEKLRYLKIWQLIVLSVVLVTTLVVIFKSKLILPLKLELVAIVLCIPVIITRFLLSIQEKKDRRYIGLLINGLARWLSIKQDIIYCFEQLSKESYLGPYQIMLIQFNQHIKSGMTVNDAFDLILEKIRDPFLRMVFTNLIFSLQHRGDLKLLMVTLEKEYTTLEEELSTRNIRLRRDKIYFYVSIIGVGVFMIYNLLFHPSSKTFLLGEWQGQILLLILSTTFLVNTLFGLTLNDQKY